MSASYLVGDQRAVMTTFLGGDNLPVDASVVTAEVHKPDATIINLTSQLFHPSTGTYRVLLPVFDQPGTWYWQIAATGNITQTVSDTFAVVDDNAGTVVIPSPGVVGAGVAAGGTVGQYLAKTGAGDYATGWQTPTQLADNATTIAGTSTTTSVSPAALANTLPHYDARRYGATGNGTTDDTTAIQTAINAANSAGGGEVRFPAGTFVISTALDMVGKTGVHLRGSSLAPSIIRQATLSTPVVRVNGSYLGLHDLQLRYVSASSTSGATALQMEGIVSFSQFENLYLWNCHTGIAYGGALSPTGEFSNSWTNIRVGTFSAQGIRLVPTATSGTGSSWNNIYVSNWTGSVAGACTDYPLQITNHSGAFNQLNVEWCDTVTAARDSVLIQQCAGLVINKMHMEGNKLPASRGFISTFTADNCTVMINGLDLYNNTAASGSVGILRPGAGTHITLSNAMVNDNASIAATWYTIFDTSIATGAVVIIDGLLDPDGHIDGFSTAYSGTAFARGYKGATAGFYGATPIARQTATAAATDAATTQTLANGIRTMLINLGLWA